MPQCNYEATHTNHQLSHWTYNQYDGMNNKKSFVNGVVEFFHNYDLNKFVKLVKLVKNIQH